MGEAGSSHGERGHCQHCRFWERLYEGQPHGECHRRIVSIGGMPGFAPMVGDGWCGEFEVGEVRV